MTPEQWQRVKETFASIVEAPVERRAELLTEICGDDRDLLREVESLLAAHAEDENDTLGPDALGLAALLDHPAADYTGRTFGPYRIVREIGRGGMGTVFVAERADGAFDRRVALKVIRRGAADPEVGRRFRRERQILATLNHPNIAFLLDGGVSTGDEPFFVMEFVEGIRIDDYCARERLTTRQRVELFLLVARAVAYAHGQNVIHRDLKPSNILVTAAGVPKLLDFGIAKLLDSDSPSDHTVTEYRAFTPEYAAPEQVAGHGSLTPAADVYSLGILLGRLLEADTQAPSAQPPPPGAELSNIIAMARRTEPERRYATAAGLVEDIERHLAGLPVVAQPDTVAYRASKFFERRRGVLTAAMLVICALLTGILLATIYHVPAANAGASDVPPAGLKSVAVLPFRALNANQPGDGESPVDDQALRVGLAEAIVGKLSQVPQLAVRPTTATVRYLDQTYEPLAVGRALEVHALLDGTLERSGDIVRLNVTLRDVATGAVLWTDGLSSEITRVVRGQESLAYRVSRLVAFHVGGHRATTLPDPTTHGSGNLAAQDAYLRGALALATSVRQVTNVLAARDGLEHAIRLDPEFALAHAGLANAYTVAAALTILAPRDAYPKAERAARRALELDPTLASAYVALAEVEGNYNWNWDAAEAHHRRALELAPNTSGPHQTYAEFLARMGRFAESAKHADTAETLDPTRVNYLAVRALHYYYEHRFKDAIAQAERALARDPNVYLAHLYASVSHAVEGNYEAGIAASRRAAALTGGAVPDTFVLGVNYALMNDRANTERVLQRLSEWSRGRYVDPFHFVAIYAYLGEKDLAFDYLERSFETRSYWMTSLKIHPVVDGLREDERFGAMMKRMRLD